MDAAWRKRPALQVLIGLDKSVINGCWWNAAWLECARYSKGQFYDVLHDVKLALLYISVSQDVEVLMPISFICMLCDLDLSASWQCICTVHLNVGKCISCAEALWSVAFSLFKILLRLIDSFFFFRAVVPVAAKSDTSAGGMRRAWTGRQVCDDTYWRCHCAVNQQIKKTKKTIPCHTQPPLYCATLCFCHVSLCASCVKQKNLLETVLTQGTETHLCSFSMYINVWWYQQQKEDRIIWHLQ